MSKDNLIKIDGQWYKQKILKGGDIGFTKVMKKSKQRPRKKTKTIFGLKF